MNPTVEDGFGSYVVTDPVEGLVLPSPWLAGYYPYSLYPQAAYPASSAGMPATVTSQFVACHDGLAAGEGADALSVWNDGTWSGDQTVEIVVADWMQSGDILGFGPGVYTGVVLQYEGHFATSYTNPYSHQAFDVWTMESSLSAGLNASGNSTVIDLRTTLGWTFPATRWASPVAAHPGIRFRASITDAGRLRVFVDGIKAVDVQATSMPSSRSLRRPGVWTHDLPLIDVFRAWASADPVTIDSTEQAGSSVTLTGARPEGSTITITALGATVGTVTYPDATSWQATISDLPSGTTTITASDGTDSASVAVDNGIVVDLSAQSGAGSAAVLVFDVSQGLPLRDSATRKWCPIRYRPSGKTAFLRRS